MVEDLNNSGKRMLSFLDGYIDTPFALGLIGFLSLASVFQKARPVARGKNLDRRWFLFYDIGQILLNGVVAFRLWGLLQNDAFGFNTRNNSAIQNMVLLSLYSLMC